MIGQFYMEISNILCYPNKEIETIIKEVNEPVIMVALASRINEQAIVDKNIVTYQDYLIEVAKIKWLSGVNYAIKKLFMLSLAKNNVEDALLYLESNQKRIDEETKPKYEFFIYCATDIAKCLKKTADNYKPVTESIKRDLSILSRYDQLILSDDYEKRMKHIIKKH